MIENKRILITGGAGFIGSNSCEQLLKHGNRVRCLDNFSTGKRSNIEALLDHPNFTLIEGDVRNIEDCITAIEGMDYVLHLAALGSVPRSINDPATSNAVNIGGFLNILIASRDAKVNRVVYAASSSTYGDSTSLPKVEDIIGKPLSPYAITKYVCELYADVFKKTYGLDTIGLRYFNVFGPKQDPNGAYAAVVPKFIHQFLDHQSPVINGNGTFSRDFTYIENVLQINSLALSTTDANALNQVYNVAYGESTILNDIVTQLKANLELFDPEVAKVDVIYGPERAGDIPHSLASIDKAKKLLGYDPKYSLSEGLKHTVKWYVEQTN